MGWLHNILNAAPEIALFAALALGHALGRLKLGSFNLGGVAGSIVVALGIGQLTGVTLPDALKAVCFGLFIYSIGFTVTYAISNVLLAVWGPVIVAFT